MAAKPRSPEAEDPKPVFYVDVSLGLNTVPEMLLEEGYEAKTYVDLGLQQNAPDTEWITKVAERGWVGLLKDDRIRRKADEQASHRTNPSALFIFTSGNATGPLQAEAYRKALPTIVRRVHQHTRPMLFTVDRSGDVGSLDAERPTRRRNGSASPRDRPRLDVAAPMSWATAPSGSGPG